MTHIVFVQRAFPLGGIETLTLRLANQMVTQGLKVTITGDAGEMSRRLDPRVDFFPVADHQDLIARLPTHLIATGRDQELVLASLHPMSIAVAQLVGRAILKRSGRLARSFHLVTHSRAFFFGANWRGKRWLYRRYFDSPPPASTYFMNDAARDAHAREWRTDLSDYPVLRLALGGEPPSWSRSQSGACNLVSVGRLVPFKAYNFEIPAIVRTLRDRGIDLRWTIWGDGEHEADVRARIAAEGVSEWVKLAGVLPYVDFTAEVVRHDLFIGMGTAVLEAAAAGVPSLCAVESAGEYCYGFLDQTPLDSVGDVVAGAPMRRLIDEVERYCVASPERRRAASIACVASAAERSATLNEMIAKISGAELWCELTTFKGLLTSALARLGLIAERAMERLRAAQRSFGQ